MIGPWTNVVLDTKDYVVYKDGFVTEGHIPFCSQRTRLGTSK